MAQINLALALLVAFIILVIILYVTHPIGVSILAGLWIFFLFWLLAGAILGNGND